jgi:hypothetical protein
MEGAVATSTMSNIFVLNDAPETRTRFPQRVIPTRVVFSFDCKLRHDRFDHRITSKKLRNDLNASGIERPIFEDREG